MIVLVFYFYKVNFQDLTVSLSKISTLVLVNLIILSIVRIFLGSLKFSFIVNHYRYNVPYLELTRQYFIAALYNNLLPSVLGGDVIRVFILSNQGVPKVEATSFILTERFLGMYSLIVLSFTFSFFIQLPGNVNYAVFLLFILINLMIILSFFFNVEYKPKSAFLHVIWDSLTFKKYGVKVISSALIFSLCFQFVSIFISYYIAVSINPGLSIVPFLALVPLVWLFSMLPVSFGGVGLREIAFVYLLGNIGMPVEDALIISMGTYISLIVSGFIGGVINLFSTRISVKKGNNEI